MSEVKVEGVALTGAGREVVRMLTLLDEHIVAARSYGSDISTEDRRQRYGREQSLQEYRKAIRGERLP